MARSYPEHGLCKAIFDHWWRLYERQYPGAFFHIPNEGKMTERAGKRLNEIGRRTGVADYCCTVKTSTYPILWMEVKFGRNQLSPAQAEFLANMRLRGHMAVVVWDLVEARFVLDNWMRDTPDAFAWYMTTDKLKDRRNVYKQQHEAREAAKNTA